MSADGGDEMTLFVRDPASDESPDNLFAQSPWADTTYTTVETMSVLQDWDENSAYHPYDVTVLNYDANDDEIRFIHKVYSITPGVGYEFTGIELNIDPIIDEISWGNSPSGQFAPPQAGDSFLDVQLHPEMWGLYVLVGSTGGTPSLRLIDRATGNQSLVAQIPGATDLVVGRRREVFVLAGNLVYRVDIDTPGAPSLLISSQALSAGGYNDATDELCLLSGTQRQLWVLPNAGQGAPQIFSLPTAIPASTNPQMAVRESDGAIAIVVPETPGLVHGLRRTSTGQLEYKVYALTGADAQSVCFDDRERLLVNTTDGKIVELQSTGTGWWSWAVVPTAESWYGNVGEATNYRVSRSRTNYDPAINANDDIDTPAEEVETLGRNVYDCPGDADGDMEIGFTDLLSLLTKWGPCNNCPEDLDGDDDVGFADLLALLTKWGPCPGL